MANLGPRVIGPAFGYGVKGAKGLWGAGTYPFRSLGNFGKTAIPVGMAGGLGLAVKEFVDSQQPEVVESQQALPPILGFGQPGKSIYGPELGEIDYSKIGSLGAGMTLPGDVFSYLNHPDVTSAVDSMIANMQRPYKRQAKSERKSGERLKETITRAEQDFQRSAGNLRREEAGARKDYHADYDERMDDTSQAMKDISDLIRGTVAAKDSGAGQAEASGRIMDSQRRAAESAMGGSLTSQGMMADMAEASAAQTKAALEAAEIDTQRNIDELRNQYLDVGLQRPELALQMAKLMQGGEQDYFDNMMSLAALQMKSQEAAGEEDDFMKWWQSYLTKESNLGELPAGEGKMYLRPSSDMAQEEMQNLMESYADGGPESAELYMKGVAERVASHIKKAAKGE